MQAFYSDHFAVSLLEAPRATDGELALTHSPAYVGAVASGLNRVW